MIHFGGKKSSNKSEAVLLNLLYTQYYICTDINLFLIGWLLCIIFLYQDASNVDSGKNLVINHWDSIF